MRNEFLSRLEYLFSIFRNLVFKIKTINVNRQDWFAFIVKLQSGFILYFCWKYGGMNTILQIHCVFRWFVLLCIILAMILAFYKWFGKKDFSTNDKLIYTLAARALEIQILLGVILYILKKSWEGFSAMDVGIMRFHALEHPLGMLIGLALISVGTAKVKKIEDHPKRHRIIAIWYTVALLIIIASIPWAFRFG